MIFKKKILCTCSLENVLEGLGARVIQTSDMMYCPKVVLRQGELRDVDVFKGYLVGRINCFSV